MKIELSNMELNLAKAKEFQKTEKGEKYYENVAEDLEAKDANDDGLVNALEIYNETSSVFSNVFKGNETFSKRAEELAQKEYELYNAYAGDDGYLDAIEYDAALQSEENATLLNEYWDMADMTSASKGEDEILGLNRRDLDNDGQVTDSEYIQHKLNQANNAFKEMPKDIQKQAVNLVLKQADVIYSFSGTDGVIDNDEYKKILNNKTFKSYFEKYLDMESKLEKHDKFSELD